MEVIGLLIIVALAVLMVARISDMKSFIIILILQLFIAYMFIAG